MNTQLVTTGALFLLILLSGFWLSRSGRPYSLLISALHKLAGVGAGFYFGLSVYQAQQAAPLSPLALGLLVLSVLLFLALVATGGLLSSEKPLPLILNFLHRWLPYLAVLATGLLVYVLSRPA